MLTLPILTIVINEIPYNTIINSKKPYWSLIRNKEIQNKLVNNILDVVDSKNMNPNTKY